MKFYFIDGEKLCLYQDGKVTAYESNYIKKYREASLVAAKNSEWKKKGRTEMLLAEDFFFDGDEDFSASLTAIAPTENPDEILYSFTVNESSGIYLKYLNDEKNVEAHVVSSNEVEFADLYAAKNCLLTTVKKGDVSADIGIFSPDRSEYKCLTSGDSLDENPSLTPEGNILFNSYGVARDANNNFLGYGESEIYELDLRTSSVKEVISRQGYSFIKPIRVGEYTYCIVRPLEDAERSNPFLDILLIPVRIAQGIVGFVSAFVSAFSGKPLVSEGKKSDGNAFVRSRKREERSLFVLNKRVNVEKELNRNKKKWNYGFIPRNWRLVRIKEDEKGESWIEYTVYEGVADYCVLDTGEVIYTNGKHIFVKEDKRTRWLLDTDCCLKLSPVAPVQVSSFHSFEEF